MNEAQIEVIRGIKKELRKKKKLTSYDQGQLDLIKKLRKKPKEGRFERVMPAIAICLGIVCIFALSYAIYSSIKDGTFAAQFAAERWVRGHEDEMFCSSMNVDNDTFAAFIKYDCMPINRITRGIKNCNGEYYVFLDKINGKWVVNEQSKTILW